MAAVPTNHSAPAAKPATPRRIEEEEVLSLLVKALDQHASTEGAQWEVRFSRPWTPVAAPAGSALEAEIVQPAFSRITSTCILRFELNADGKLLGSWQMPVQVRRLEKVLVAGATLTRGSPLGGASLVREVRDVMQLRNPLTELPSDADAYEIGETVAAGAPLTARSVGLRPVVFRGQTADAIVEDGAMRISLKVEVLQEGVPGQVVRVRNVQSRREFRGKVQDGHTIIVLP